MPHNLGLRAGWVPCVGFQPPKPTSFIVEDQENPIAAECERAFRRIREENPAMDGPAGDEYEMIQPPIAQPEKPNMKLLMSSKGVQDHHQVAEHYNNLMNNALQSPEIKHAAPEFNNPSGKGAELFAKRKKRMDKFIVDESTLQKTQSMTQQHHQTTMMSSSTSSSSFNSGISTNQNLAETFCDRADLKAAASTISNWSDLPRPVPFATGLSVGIKAPAAVAPPVPVPVAAPAPAPIAAPAPVAPPTLATGSGPMYTAEVKVVQQGSMPPTPAEGPHHNLLDLVEQEKADRRKSACFNLAAKGWGTYANFYTPINFATKS